jgi:hypothetical protein
VEQEFVIHVHIEIKLCSRRDKKLIKSLFERNKIAFDELIIDDELRTYLVAVLAYFPDVERYVYLNLIVFFFYFGCKEIFHGTLSPFSAVANEKSI